MSMIRISLFAALGMLMLACSSSTDNPTGNTLPGYSGQPGELIVVIPTDQWKSPIGDSIAEYFQESYPVLPQYETRLQIDPQNYENFNKYYSRARNVLIVNVEEVVDNRDVRTVVHKKTNAKDQLIFEIIARTEDEFMEELRKNYYSIIKTIEDKEMDRMRFKPERERNLKAEKQLLETHGIEMNIPKWMSVMENKENFFSLIGPEYQGKKAATQEGIIIYHSPYTADSLLNRNELLIRRDSTLKKYVSGPTDGSYMKTVYVDGYLPEFREMSLDDNYTAEIRGLWDLTLVLKGGPFVSVSMVDPNTGRLVTAEAYVHAPGESKRELIRRLEAVIKSISFPDPQV